MQVETEPSQLDSQRQIEKSLSLEKKAHDTFYGQGSSYETEGDICFSKEIFEKRMAYPWRTSFNLYSAETQRFIEKINIFSGDTSIENGAVLEYGCGRGDLSCYLALKGFNEVHGFDLSENAIKFAQRLEKSSNLQGKVFFKQMNAQALEYPDQKFVFVVGHGVLHHISKYPGTASELHRVMKDGATAIFLENLGNGPIWSLIRRITMGDTEFGDINLSTGYLKRWGASFQDFKLRGFYVFFMAKRFCFIREEKQDGSVRKVNRFRGVTWFLMRMLLSTLYLLDELIFNHTPLGNYFGGMCIVTLRK